MSFFQPAQFLQIQNVLSVEEQTDLLNYVFDRQTHFVPTSTSTGELDYRQSTILYCTEEYEHWIIGKVKSFLTKLLEEWQIEPFPVTQIEVQLTAHNDGNYYKVHNDNGSDDAAERMISYVYYFNREPKKFSGGALRIYDLNIENGLYLQAESYQEIQPINNSIVFFPSHFLHEVLPVICPSRQFADSRFTLNGWVRRATL